MRCIYEAGGVRQVNFVHTYLLQPPITTTFSLALRSQRFGFNSSSPALFLARATDWAALNHLSEHQAPEA